jgi:hypothetical protein
MKSGYYDLRLRSYLRRLGLVKLARGRKGLKEMREK